MNGERGRYYEDFTVGDVYRNSRGRTILEADNTWFTLLTMNTHPLHFNTDYASRTEWKRPLVNSGLTVAIVLGLTVPDLSQHSIANLGWKDIVLSHPVFAGDTLYVESRVLGLRESRSRPDAGIVTARSRGLNQDGVVCLSWVRSILVLKRVRAKCNEAFPSPRTPIDAEDP